MHILIVLIGRSSNNMGMMYGEINKINMDNGSINNVAKSIAFLITSPHSEYFFSPNRLDTIACVAVRSAIPILVKINTSNPPIPTADNEPISNLPTIAVSHIVIITLLRLLKIIGNPNRKIDLLSLISCGKIFIIYDLQIETNKLKEMQIFYT